MNEVLQKIILGVIQGLTEFLPVSSSGHLEIVKVLIGDESVNGDGLLTTVVLHFGTALATVVVFRNDILHIISDLFIHRSSDTIKFTLAILVSMVPVVIAGLFFEGQVNSLFSGNLLLVGLCLLITGGLLLLADRAKTTDKKVSVFQGFLIGIAQLVAILPGISRSGATISATVLLGVDRDRAARFSFLMVVPLIFGKMLKDLLSNEMVLYDTSWFALFMGFTAAFLVGIWACQWMIRLVKKSKLFYFTIYCAIAGTFAIALYFL